MIETLGRADAADLLALSGSIGWNHTSDDWSTILEAGRIFGHRAGEGGLASTGALFDFGPTLASIGMILVARSHRRHGLARAMMQHCLAQAGRRPVTLIATVLSEPLYRSLGFVEVGRVCRMLRDEASPGERVPSFAESDWDEVATLDREVFGADRRLMLRALFTRAAASAVLRDPRGGLRGFGIATRQGAQLVVGPVVADAAGDALRLLRALVVGHAGLTRVEMPTARSDFDTALTTLGFRRVDDAPLMLLGGTAMPGRRERLFALASRGFG